MSDVKNWFLQPMKPPKFWGLVLEPLPVWLMTGNYREYRDYGTPVYLLKTLSVGLKTILSIIAIALEQACLILAEKDHV